MAKQCTFYYVDADYMTTGILLDNGNIIDCETGDEILASEINAEDVGRYNKRFDKPVTIIRIYSDWSDLSELIG